MSHNSTLSTAVITQKQQFGVLAHEWLANGATAFEVWDASHMLADWTHNLPASPSYISAPIEVAGKQVGQLRVAGISGERAHTRLHAEAGLVANLIRLEYELEVTVKKLVNSQDQLSALYQVTQSTRSHLNIDDVAQSLMRAMVKLFKIESAFTLFKSPDSPIFTKYYPTLPTPEPEMRELFTRLQTIGTELVINHDNHRYERPRTIDTLLFLPVPTHSSVQTSLGLINKWRGDFDEADLKLARAIATQAGAQIENALLHQEVIGQAKLQTEMELAKSVQLQLLPQQAIKVTGLDLYAKSRPASQVGGDFYDFVRLSDNSILFAVGDVSGKGMPAALLMAMTRTVIRSALRFLPQPMPAQVMEHSNQELYDDFTEVRMFATVFGGRYFPTTGQFMYANAGHSPVIYCPKGGKPHLLRADNPAIGVLPAGKVVERTLQLGVGDVLVIGTDGLSEARNIVNEFFGYDRLLNLVSDLAKLPAQEIAESLFGHISEFSFGHPQVDDQTVMVIKRVAK